MQYRPHDYQRHATEQLLRHEQHALFLDPGLGKTSITLTAIAELLRRGEVRKALVVAPLRVARQVWTGEARKWDHLRHLRVARVLGTERERIAALRRPADVWVVNRENVVWLVRHYRRDWPFDMVVVDELSSFKSPAAKRFRALRAVRPYVRRIVGLTATPAPNGLLDLWSQIHLLDQGQRLGSYGGYQARYFRRDDDGRWRLRPGAEKAIHARIADLCVSMRAQDWLEMPDLVRRTVHVQLSPAARRAYGQMESEMLLPYGDGDAITASSAAVLGGKLLQLANGAVYDAEGRARTVHDEKLDALEELVESCAGNPLLVFYGFRHDLARIRARLPQARVLDGEASIDAWNRGEVEVLLAHPASAGHGLNLQQGGHQMAWFGLPWSLELYEQAIGRLWRQGQASRVIVHHLVAEGTIDEDVLRVLALKGGRQDKLLDALRLRASRARDAPAPRREAVGTG